jgi:hypothetical protein
MTLLFCTQAFAGQEWAISIDQNKDQVSYQKGELLFSYPKSNVAPEVLEVKSIGGFQVVLFLARTSGSFVMFEEWYGAVFDKENKLVGIYPYNYEIISEAPKRKLNQPKWSISGKKLTITEPELEMKVVLELP